MDNFSLRNREKISWFKFSKISFWAHAFFILITISTLYYIIINDRFYCYAFQHSSYYLFIIKCLHSGKVRKGHFYCGCSGIIIGIYFSFKPFSRWSISVMIISIHPLILTSMILGIVFLDIKIGSSPFILLRDVISAPIFNINQLYSEMDRVEPIASKLLDGYSSSYFIFGFAGIVPFAYAISALRIGDLSRILPTRSGWCFGNYSRNRYHDGCYLAYETFLVDTGIGILLRMLFMYPLFLVIFILYYLLRRKNNIIKCH